jgi:surface antigen
MKKMLISCALAIGLSACNTTGMPIKQTVGALGGAAAGGLAGAQFGKGNGQLAMAAGGTLIGALLGSEVGKSLDRADTLAVGRASEQAYTAPIGQPITWSNPETGNYGSITPTREGRTQNGGYCREFTQTIYVGGRSQQATGRACQQPDGTWQIVG